MTDNVIISTIIRHIMEWNHTDLCQICKTPTVFGTELANCACIVCRLPYYGVAS